MNNCKKDFEEWAVSENFNIRPSHNDDGYMALSTRHAFKGWQAASSRATTVKLPETCVAEFLYDNGDKYTLEYYEPEWVRKALDDAGIKYE